MGHKPSHNRRGSLSMEEVNGDLDAAVAPECETSLVSLLDESSKTLS